MHDALSIEPVVAAAVLALLALLTATVPETDEWPVRDLRPVSKWRALLLTTLLEAEDERHDSNRIIMVITKHFIIDILNIILYRFEPNIWQQLNA